VGNCKSGCARSGAIGRETHTPEAGGRLGEFEFHVTSRAAEILRLGDLANDFLFGFFVGEENELARRERSCQTDNGAVAED
jgi:hypothetical protein